MATDDETLYEDAAAHPVPRELRRLAQAVTDLAERPLFALDAPTTRHAVADLETLQCHLDAFRLALAAHADGVDVAAQCGATSTAAWWAVSTRRGRQATGREVRTGLALAGRWHRVREALTSAGMNLEQAGVVVRALEDLPEDLDPELVALAETRLVELAAEHGPSGLTILGRRILSVVAPEIGEEEDRRRLEEAERIARQKRRLTLAFDGHGACHGRFTLPEVQGRALQTMLLGFAAPGHVNAAGHAAGHAEGAGGEGWVRGRPTPAKLGEAFGELIESYPKDRAPRAGGLSATLVITTTLADLQAGLHGAHLDTGEELSVGQTRRLACEASIVPVVMGGRSEILDAGRGRRLFGGTQIVALRTRDGGCTAEACDWPASLCHAHHDDSWRSGGRTDVNRGRLLCPHHHARIHDTAYEHTVLNGNKVRFHRRT